MDASLRSQLAAHLEAYHRERANRSSSPEKTNDQQHYGPIPYGTAGFRGDAVTIEPLYYNVGLIAGLRCLQLGANIGIMVTASHNQVTDNGVKFIDSSGEMLEAQWEPLVEQFCNITNDAQTLLDQLDHLVTQFKINTGDKSNGCILIGMDNRPSSEALVDLIVQGLKAWSPLVDCFDYGLITTPALHYLVAESNKRSIRELPIHSTYYEQLATGFSRISELINGMDSSDREKLYSSSDFVIDCANGVGSETMHNLLRNQSFSQALPVKLINTGDGILNKSCGADFVKTTHRLPTFANDLSKRYAALDGDADRVVYFFLAEGDQGEASSGDNLSLKLLDGDKIMVLFAIFMKSSLSKAALDDKLSFGAVQTAYANGASTDYLTSQLGIKVDCVSTGVKNLHKKVVDYDVGIYFEANGHGTIWISPKARDLIEKCTVDELRMLLPIINNYTGDAISDILIVESILQFYGWDVKHWYDLYRDRPNSLLKVQVSDRNKLRSTDADRVCLEPVGLQDSIDAIMEEFGPESRCFVRASGTEDVVRIYAEANDQASTEKLAHLVSNEVIKFCA